MHIVIILFIGFMGTALGAPQPLSASQQPTDTMSVSLEEAVARARSQNPSLRAAFAEAHTTSQDALAATKAFLPTIRADVVGSRTTDPVGVFGLKLRQSAFGTTDLAIDALIDPDPITGFSTALTVELPLFSPEGLYGFRAARSGARAHGAQADRAAGGTAFQVTQAYWDVQLASGALEALQTALDAAREHARQAKALHEQGMVTGLDERLASLRASEIEVRLVKAEADAENALSHLKALLAVDESTHLRLTDALRTTPVESDSTVCEGACPLDARGDLRALSLGVDAAASSQKSAWGAQLPQVVAFGAVTHHGADGPWRSGSGDWALGLGVRWNLFPGLAGVAAVRRANAQADVAKARLEAAKRGAEAEVQSAERRLEATGKAVEIARRAEAEAQVALEQASHRYRTGISTITELLDVEAASMNAALSHLSARRDLQVAGAAVAFAYGALDR